MAGGTFSAKRWHALVQAVPYPLVLLASNGEVRWSSRPIPGVGVLEEGDDFGERLGQPRSAVLRRIARVIATRGTESYRIGVGGVALRITFSVVEDADGLRVLASCHDNTELERGRAQLAESAAAHDEVERKISQARLQESLGNLAGGLAHDFNNLLSSVLTNSYYVSEELPDDSALHEPVIEIAEAAERAGDLCRQLMAFAGRGQVRLSRIDLGALCEELIPELSREHRVKVVAQLEDGAVVHGDARQLRTVIRQLVDNASQAMGSHGGRVVIRVGSQLATDAQLDGPAPGYPPVSGRYSWVEIHDTGPGVPKAVRERMFEPFFSTLAHRRGLGLAAVLGIIRAHQGTLTLDAAEGGACFRAWIPHADGVEMPVDTTVAPSSDTAAGDVILVVDDEIAVRTACGRILERAGFTCRFASNGREAVTLFEAQASQIGLVLLDLSMPELDGNEALYLLRQRAPELPVVMMSGYEVGMTQLDPIQDAGATAYLHKPFSPQVLMSTVRNLLEGS